MPIPKDRCPDSPGVTYVLLLSSAFALTSLWPTYSAGDELTLNEVQSTPRSIGDFRCYAGPSKAVGFIIQNLADTGGQVKTGELWNYFHSQGIDSLDRLTLVINVNPDLGTEQGFMMDSLTLTIAEAQTEAANGAKMITNASLNRNGKNMLILRSGDPKSFTPHARMEFELGYDFMKRFNSDSQDTVSLNFNTRSGAIEQALFGFPQTNSQAQDSHLQNLLLFIAFWAIVFLLMYLFLSPKTPQTRNPETNRTSLSSTDQDPLPRTSPSPGLSTDGDSLTQL